MALELAILTPVVIIMLLAVVAFGRVTHGRQLVDEAAAAGGRAAALATTPQQATTAARTDAQDTLTQAGLSCASFRIEVDTHDFTAGGQVVVTVHCTTSLTSTALTGLPDRIQLTSTSITPLEQLRDFTRSTS